MKTFFKKSLILLALLFGVSFTTNLALPVSTFAVDETVVEESEETTGNESFVTDDPVSDRSSCRTFLGMYSWDCGVDIESIDSTDSLTNSIVIIATNVLIDLAIISAYLVLGYTIYGGYLYIFANGDVGKVAGGKKTLTRAFIGLAIVGCANIILQTIRLAFMNNTGAFNCDPLTGANCMNNPDELVTNAVGWFIGIAGVIAVIFLVIGGINYITSAGDSGKVQKAKNTITYSIMGLVVVGLSQVIVGFITDIVNKANDGADFGSAIQIILNSIIGIAGLVAVAYLVLAGINYMTSAGDAGKIKKAKDTILYSIIGLIVCALSFVIVNWAIGIINNPTSTEGESSEVEDSGTDSGSGAPEQTSLLSENSIAFLEEKL